MTKDSEELQLAKNRDVSIWTTWFDEHYRDIYRYAYARVGGREDAEDIASQVFVEALRSIETFEDQGKPVLAWLYGIARHLIAQKVRRDSRMPRISMPGLLQSDDGSADSIIDRLDLWEAIRQLTPEQQEVIVLRFFLSKTTKQVADIISRQENAVYALQFRALNSLRRLLAAKDALPASERDEEP